MFDNFITALHNITKNSVFNYEFTFTPRETEFIQGAIARLERIKLSFDLNQNLIEKEEIYTLRNIYLKEINNLIESISEFIKRTTTEQDNSDTGKDQFLNIKFQNLKHFLEKIKQLFQPLETRSIEKIKESGKNILFLEFIFTTNIRLFLSENEELDIIEAFVNAPSTKESLKKQKIISSIKEPLGRLLNTNIEKIKNSSNLSNEILNILKRIFLVLESTKSNEIAYEVIDKEIKIFFFRSSLHFSLNIEEKTQLLISLKTLPEEELEVVVKELQTNTLIDWGNLCNYWKTHYSEKSDFDFLKGFKDPEKDSKIYNLPRANLAYMKQFYKLQPWDRIQIAENCKLLQVSVENAINASAVSGSYFKACSPVGKSTEELDFRAAAKLIAAHNFLSSQAKKISLPSDNNSPNNNANSSNYLQCS